jgi:hypothetical protein
VNLTTLSELPEGAPIMTGTFSINYHPVIVLFDTGATHSFISMNCGTKLGLDIYPVNGVYMITTPGGNISSNQVCRSVPIQMGNNLMKADLLLLDLKGVDVLLGVNWMTQHHVSLDIPSRTVEIGFPENEPTILYLPKPMPYLRSNLRIFQSSVNIQMFFRMTYLECPQTEKLSSSSNSNLVQPLFLRDLTECLLMSWLN